MAVVQLDARVRVVMRKDSAGACCKGGLENIWSNQDDDVD